MCIQIFTSYIDTHLFIYPYTYPCIYFPPWIYTHIYVFIWVVPCVWYVAEICHKDSFGRGISSLYVNSAHPFYSIFVHSILFILSFCDSVAIGKVGCNSSHLSAQMLAMRHPCMIAARPLNLRRLGVWPTCSTAVGTGKRWSGGVRAVSRAAVMRVSGSK